MATRGRNQYSDFHPNVGQRLTTERDLAKQKGELHMQRDGVHNLGAPHFPPSENLPPQAKRLQAKKRKQQKREKRPAEQAQARSAVEPPREAYPDALPRREDARAAMKEGIIGRSRPVLRDAQTHWEAVVEAAGKFASESLSLLRTPGDLMRALLQKPRQA